MRPVRNAFLDFQLTTLFDKNIPVPIRVNRYKRNLILLNMKNCFQLFRFILTGIELLLA